MPRRISPARAFVSLNPAIGGKLVSAYKITGDIPFQLTDCPETILQDLLAKQILLPADDNRYFFNPLVASLIEESGVVS